MELKRIDLKAGVIVEDAPPYANVVRAVLPPETWADLTERGYPGVGYWPVVDLTPGYDSATHDLGTHSQTIDAKGQRVVSAWTIVERPKAPAVVLRVPMRNARRALIRVGLLKPVELYLAGMEGIDGELARNDWHTALTIARDNEVVTRLIPALGKTESEIDAMFAEALAESLED